MKKTVNFILCIHNHQPVGNFEDVFESNYRLAYEPFLRLAQQYRQIKFSLHYSGSLLEWIERTHPKFITEIKSMVERDQVEIMGGGFCDPILTMLSDTDKIGQITLFSEYLKKHFNTEPVGMWLAERVWEQYLTRYIAEAGLKYTVVDDFHFRGAGIPEKRLAGFFITEEVGKCLAIFPGSEKLRYAIPFSDPEVTIEILRQSATESGDKIVVYADDGEKFGSWPKTYQHCYENKWLERFFRTLQANQDWINFITFRDAIERFKPTGRVYLPDMAYREMTEWALPTETQVGYEDLIERLKQAGLYEKASGFIKGGFWRNFNVKYPEINLMYSRMREVSEKVNNLNKKSPYYQEARLALYHGQCNCPYWHGVFGGFYLPHLRHSIYKHLIRAEKFVLPLSLPSPSRGEGKGEGEKGRQRGLSSLIESDFDCDGHPEIRLTNRHLACYFKPHQGGALYELDIIEKEFNPLATVTRRPEAYHYKIIKAQSLGAVQEATTIHNLILSKEKGLENLLYYDSYPRLTLLDHFLDKTCRLEDIAKSHYGEEGDFLTGVYSVKVNDRKGRCLPIPQGRQRGLSSLSLSLSLVREGRVIKENKTHSVRVEKLIDFLPHPKIGLDIIYKITNMDSELLEARFGVEFNLSMLAGNAPDRFYYDGGKDNLGPLITVGEVKGQRRFGIKDLYQKIDIGLRFDEPADIWYFPVQSVSQSESGFELIYQNSVIIPRWPVQLEPGGLWQVRIRKEIIFL